MVVAIVALVVAATGTGYAAVQLGQGSVGSAQIKDNSVRSVDLKAGPAQPVLGPGKTMIGYFGAAAGDSTEGYAYDAITFPARLPGAFKNTNVQYLEEGADYTKRCPGPGQAKRGWACFYVGQSNMMDLAYIYNQNYNYHAVADYGVRIYWYPQGTSNYADGQWVIRAP